MRFKLRLVVLCLGAWVQPSFAQELPPPPPPPQIVVVSPAPVSAVPIATAPPAREPSGRELQELEPQARALFHVGFGAGLIHPNESSGYNQLQRIGFNTPYGSVHINAGAQLVATSWLRLGAELSYEFAGNTTERNFRGATRTESVRFHMGSLELSATPFLAVRRLQLGLRLAGGFGFSRWTLNSMATGSGMYRVSVAIDFYAPIGRNGKRGVDFRFGYQLRRTLATGPIDLVFSHNALFFNIAYMFGAGQ